MDFNDVAKVEAALVAWREERSNGVNGMLGVLFLIRNRVKAGWFQGNWYLNITGHNQFSSMTVRGDSQTTAFPEPHDPNFLAVLQHVDLVYDGTTVDNLTNGALYYADLNNPSFEKGGWFDRNILQKPEEHPRVAQIGTTTYFR